jgi:hypothetical protein
MARKKTVKTEQSPMTTSQEDVTLTTVTVEEESTETKADVPETDNIAVIEAQEATQDVVEGTESDNPHVGSDVDTFFKEQALIDLTPVGAEVIVETGCPLIDNIINPTNEEEELITLIDNMEGSPDNQENPEDNYTEVDEDGDGVPEHYVFDWTGKPVAATLMHIRETKINSLVEKVMFASTLGGELYKSGVQLNRVPYRANVLIPNDKVAQFLSGEGKLEYEEGFPYTPVTVKGVASHLFLKRVMVVSKKGAVIAPKKKCTNNAGFLVSLLCKAPVAQSASFQLAAHKPKYSVDELKELSAESLRIVCGWYNISYRGKIQSRIDIKSAQDESK